jgi:hypothetical protein
MFCDYCGEFNEDSNLLCQNCGRSLHETIEENIDSNNEVCDVFLDDDYILDYEIADYGEGVVDNLDGYIRDSKINNYEILLEWDVIILASFMFVILFESICIISKFYALIFATLFTLIYTIIAVNNKWTLFITFPLILLLILSFNMFFVL